ncbi:uncharacterized protein LOC123562061 [Mercenaria mercenaria]|uniref:uncharacterized protein LOC123562061 n=1 Tax=Mercenaria mercenaria TaxID=6596 RepID=UPI00234F4892|nr:uncharacterized protein LOC123562061 [Mercenaria mercenaria]
MQKVKEKQLCFNCLRKHRVINCTSQRRCLVCKKKHHTSICNNKSKEHNSGGNVPDVQSSKPETAVLHSSTQETSHGVLLKTAISKVTSGNITRDTHILFDEGAQKSFITETLAQELQLSTSGTETLHLATFGNQEQQLKHVDSATVYLITNQKKRIPINVLIVPTISVPISTSLHNTASHLPYLRGLNLAHPVSGDEVFTISLLIGADHYWDVIEDHIIRGCGPTAVKSKIGYLLSGPVNAYCNNTTSKMNHIFNVMTTRARDENAIERFWSLESIGITPCKDEHEKTDYLAQYQQTSIEFTDDKYTAALPWKLDHDPLPTNYNITKKRTESTIRRLSQEPDMLKKYGEIISEQERRGFIEKINDVAQTSNAVHYIPHHPVRKESSTTPIRIVYDCSCKQSSSQPSLNDCLESTAPVLNELTSILMRFRLEKYAVATDIEKAFLHVGLQEKDRDVTRFLWLTDPSDPKSQLCTYRFKAVLFGATCSPFILNATILKHLELNKTNKAAEIIKRDLYVDNILSSFEEKRDLLTYFRDARDLMKCASMNLRSWSSNNSELKAIATREGVIDRDEVTKVLGMCWKPETDSMAYRHHKIPKLDSVTKRDILRYSSRIYDPLGLLSPVTVRAKLLLQQLWKDKFDWDVPLPLEVQDKWNKLAEDLNTVTDTEFSRQYIRQSKHKQTINNSRTKSTLHVFVDSSLKSYGAAVYIVNADGSRLVIAKNRVAPVKSMTLPQLELMEAVVGARLVQHVQESLNISDVICWSDSQIVLHWLSTSKPLKRFVQNRVIEIQTLTKNYPWHYCPTYDNPSDLLTRGIPADQLLQNDLWNSGPSWIQNQSNWPVWKPTENEMQTTTKTQTTVSDISLPSDATKMSVVCSIKCSTNEGIHQVINIEKYSKYFRLLRVTAYLLRFISNCRNTQTKLTDELTTAEIERAEIRWLKCCQESTYPDEMSSLKSNTTKRLPLVKQLRLFVDKSGIIRCEGRIHNAPLSDVTKFPYLLPKRHPLTRLIVLDTHENQLHAGTNATATQLRQKYWIPATRQCVKSILRKCTICRRVQGKPYRAPDPPPLPKVRVEESPPFTVTGVDYTGALYVRDHSGSVIKVYVCLFTCANSRALHLEVVPDLSKESFLLAFRRFVSRRSVPRVMMSDNATTFTSASESLKHIFQSTQVRETLSRKGTEWKFIPKRAPWYGGWWERLIGLTKIALKKVVGCSLVTMETLQTVVTEIEAMLNDRPLTQMSSSVDDMDPLTPSHLLYGRRLTSLPYNTTTLDFENSSKFDEHSAVTKQAKLQSKLLDHFWKRWRMEYLTALRESHRKSGTNEQMIAVGDVVQIHDECPRNRWKLGVVEQLITGRDDRTRAATIRTANGTTTRPIVKLYPLECVNYRNT